MCTQVPKTSKNTKHVLQVKQVQHVFPTSSTSKFISGVARLVRLPSQHGRLWPKGFGCLFDGVDPGIAHGRLAL